jgi:di/tricarboxylate transporter
MTGDALLVFVILGVTILLFVSDRLRLDVVAVLSMLALTLAGVVTPAEALAGFSAPIVIMIAGLFVVGGGLARTGTAERFGRAIGAAAGEGRVGLTTVLMLGAGALSAFMSSTGTVAVMLPVTASLAWGARLSPSLLLIPLSIGASLGGMLTLIGTPPNLIVAAELDAAGLEPFGFFDFTPVGLAALAVGVAVLAALGGRLLPARASADGPAGDGPAAVPGADLVRAFGVGEIVRLRVPGGTPLVGVSPAQARLRQRYGVNVVDILRPGPMGRLRRLPHTGNQPFHAGDEVDVQGDAEAVRRVAADLGLRPLEPQAEPESMLAEVLLTPRSRLIGATLADVGFRDRYGANVLSVRRRGQPVDGPLATEPLQFGDLLLVSGTRGRIKGLQREASDVVVVARTPTVPAGGPLTAGQVTAIGIVVGMMGLLTFEVVPPAIAVLMAAVAMVLTRCLRVETAYRSVNWESVVLIAAILPMATALEKTGGMDLVIRQLAALDAAGPTALLAALFVVTGVLSQVISNTATTLLVAPVALGAAVGIGASPYPFLMGVAVAASSAFATPVASPINTLVLGPGDYRFGDFFRVGLLVQVLLLVLTLVLVPLLFPFEPGG